MVFSLLAILVGTDVGVAVFTCASGIQGTVDMEDLETVETDDAVELLKNTVKVISDRITAVVGVTGVEANAEFVFCFNFVDDGPSALQRYGRFQCLCRPSSQDRW